MKRFKQKGFKVLDQINYILKPSQPMVHPYKYATNTKCFMAKLFLKNSETFTHMVHTLLINYPVPREGYNKGCNFLRAAKLINVHMHQHMSLLVAKS